MWKCTILNIAHSGEHVCIQLKAYESVVESLHLSHPQFWLAMAPKAKVVPAPKAAAAANWQRTRGFIQPRRAGLMGNINGPARPLRILIRTSMEGAIWPCGTSQLGNDSAEAIAEYMLQIDEQKQGEILLIISRYRTQWMPAILRYFRTKFLNARHRTDQNWGVGTLIMAPGGAIMG